MSEPASTTRNDCYGGKREREAAAGNESTGRVAAPRVRFSLETQILPATREDPSTIVVRANDVITLRFLSTDGIVHEVAPTFTHQLFDNEQIAILETSHPSVVVEIDMQNMMQRLEFTGPLEAEERIDISHRLKPVLPAAAVNINAVKGLLVHTFFNGGDSFEVRLVSHREDGVCELIGACEKLAMWFIETADSVDFKDDKWEALLVFKKCAGGTRHELVAYMTLYTFHNPIMGSKVRICQALVLPMYQKRGLGREVLRAAYHVCRGRDTVTEVTVEDPASGFQRLRDAVDIECFLEGCCGSGSPLIGYDAALRMLTDELFCPNLIIDKCSQYMKITKLQAEFAIDALKYFFIATRGEAGKSCGDHYAVPDMKRWRLDAKRKLLKRYPELRNLPKPEMQRELEAVFQEHLDRITAAGRSRNLRAYVADLKVFDSTRTSET